MGKKKFLFLLGSLEHSKCGVCDYTLLLIDKLAQQGFTCICVALNDKHLLNTDFINSSPIDAHLYKFYRFSSMSSWRERIKKLNTIIDRFNPDYISLQYVPWSFDKYGLPFNLLYLLYFIRSDCPWHIMAHELWTLPKQGFIKKIHSVLQKILTITLFMYINPKVLHVSNNYCKVLLREHRIKAKLLPIFSNIPCLYPRPNISSSLSSWSFIFFGTFSKNWPYEDFFSRIESLRSISGISHCKFYLVGNCGDFAKSLWRNFNLKSKTLYSSFSFISTGSLSVEKISKLMSQADFGVSTTPLHLIEKSGSVAAMILHGLPIIVNNILTGRFDSNQLYLNTNQLVIIDDFFEENILNVSHSFTQKISLL